MTGMAGNTLGLYISIPFCRSKCTYCNFASGVYPASEHARYVARVIDDMAAAGAWAGRMSVELPRTVDTVYLGGGTPTLLAPELLERLFAAMRAEFDIEPDAEITVECAPGQLEDATLAALVAAGVNRFSLGVQSFIDREAAVSGRLHTRATILEDLRRLRAAGIANLSVDLIAGLPGQTFASWQQSVAALIDCGVPHASLYMLEVDEDSRLGREVLAHGARYHAELVPNDDAIARMYSEAIETLDRAGLAQYEISNFCRPGFASRHNLRYWKRRPYLGLGLDASSMLREALTFHTRDNSPSPRTPVLKGHGFSRAAERPKQVAALAAEEMQSSESAFSQGLKPEIPIIPPAARLKPRVFKTAGFETPELITGEGLSRSTASQEGYVIRTTTTSDLRAFFDASELEESVWLAPGRQHEEAWFLGLRLNTGVDVGAVEREFGRETVMRALEAVALLAEAGLVISDGKSVRLTPRGRLLSNDVFQEFLDLEADSRGVS
jgi:oxygen-independent coproporphyrinogen-3 oxidase